MMTDPLVGTEELPNLTLEADAKISKRLWFARKIPCSFRFTDLGRRSVGPVSTIVWIALLHGAALAYMKIRKSEAASVTALPRPSGVSRPDNAIRCDACAKAISASRSTGDA
jgi:hypothetical protein